MSQGTVMWRGIHKLTEECGEVLQVLGKLGPYPDGQHPDGGPDLAVRLEEELADLRAAIQYVVQANGLDARRIAIRQGQKLKKFEGWVLTGLNPGEPQL